MPDDLDLEYTTEWVDIDDLKPHPRNYQEHPEEQIEEIRASIRKHGIYKNIVAAKDLTILAGHGVTEGAKAEGYPKIPVRVLEIGPEEPEAYQVMIGDNEQSRLAIRDDRLLSEIMSELRENDPQYLTGTGIGAEALDDMIKELDAGPGEQEEAYTRKIDTPIYEVTGEKPPPESLRDRTKADKLRSEILDADLPDEVRSFLLDAAERHVVFQYDLIAEFYAHASEEVQALMEDSALVIIDYEKAIEEGYVKLTKAILEARAQEEAEEAHA